MMMRSARLPVTDIVDLEPVEEVVRAGFHQEGLLVRDLRSLGVAVALEVVLKLIP
jgi:hypothetical protein